MGTGQTDDGAAEQGDSTHIVRRRSLVAGAAALVVGLLAKQSAEVVQAGTDGDLLPNILNPINATTGVSGPIPATPAWRVTNSFNAGFDNAGDGMQGYATTGGASPVIGVYGRNNDTAGIGVQGTAPSGTGVFGDTAAGYGVYGSSTSGYGVYGISGTKGMNTSLPGVFGSGPSLGIRGESPNGIAVAGLITAAGNGNAAVFGTNQNGPGMQGESTTDHGLVGKSFSSDGHAGLLGAARAPGAIGLRGSAFAAGGVAGTFDGNVNITGTLTIGGGKSAYVSHPDGTNRLLYCVESPESWFEDFGRSKLANGKATVTFDPDFAAVTKMDDYHVFLTEEGTHYQLIVTNMTPTGFTVEADAELFTLKGKDVGTLSASFSWRVVGKRADFEGKRLAKYTPPPLLTLPPTPSALLSSGGGTDNRP